MKRIAFMILLGVIFFYNQVWAQIYTAVFTKESVTQKTAIIFIVTVNVAVSDGGQEVFNKSYSVQYNTNAPDLEGMKSEIMGKVQADWDKYIAQKAIFDAQALENAITAMQTIANNYINQ